MAVKIYFDVTRSGETGLNIWRETGKDEFTYICSINYALDISHYDANLCSCFIGKKLGKGIDNSMGGLLRNLMNKKLKPDGLREKLESENPVVEFRFRRSFQEEPIYRINIRYLPPRVQPWTEDSS